MTQTIRGTLHQSNNAKAAITIPWGTHARIRFTLFDTDDVTPLDASAAVIQFAFRKPGQSTPLFAAESPDDFDMTDADVGIVILTITPTATTGLKPDHYEYDVGMLSDAGEQYQLVAPWRLTVSPKVSVIVAPE